MVKFILNVSVAPHFVALFDDKNNLIAHREWDDFRAGSQIVWDFLRNHDIGTGADLDFIGGVSGPGGFSTLRVGGAILNALAFKFDLPVHQARADLLARALIGSDDFLLNSFGDGVFVPDGEALKRVPVSEVSTDKAFFIDWLPEEKQKYFQKITTDKNIVATTFEILQNTKSRKLFLPDYEYPPVQ